MRRVPFSALVLMILSVFSFLTFFSGIVPSASAASTGFSFAASGDLGSLTASTSVSNLNRLVTANPNFFLGLGNYAYDPTVTGDIWCSEFKANFNGIQIIPGDHDTGGHNSTAFGETHSYERYVNGCPLTIGVGIVCGPVQGDCYGKEYYFDYPSGNPIARFIFTSPKIYNITGVCTSSPACSSGTGQPCTDVYGCWQYNANDVHYNWAAGAIDDARAKGIRWVIVATHKLCISSSDATCSMGIAFFNMLVQKKVDLVIQAHDNAYERSKQLGFNGSTCPNVSTDGKGYAVYNSACIVDDGHANYTRGAGTVVVVQGAWINDLYGVNASASHLENIAEAPYFAKLMGKNTPSNGLGFTQYTVSASKIDVRTNFAGTFAETFADSFSIATGPNPAPVVSWSPQSPQTGQIVAFTASATGGVGPYSFAWDFGDGDKATGISVSHIYSSARLFNVTTSAIDSTNHTGSSRSLIAVGSWNSAVGCSPTVSTVEQVVGKVSIQRNATNPSSVGADYSGGGFKLAGNLPFGSSPQSWPFSKRSLQPQCSVNGVPSFVELHNVTLTAPASVATYDCRTAYDVSNGAGLFPNGQNCDVVFSVGNSSATTCPACFMHRIYAEIDGDWNASNIAPLVPPSPGQMIDVQGFVYWDADSLNFSGHNWSGWELHPFTAWKVSRPALSVSINTSPSSPGIGQQVTFTATVSGGTGPYSLSWDFGDGSVASGMSTSHAYSINGTVFVHLGVTDSLGASGVASASIQVSSALSASFSFSPSLGVVGQPVTFAAAAAGGTGPYSYGWTFGDGSSGTGKNTVHSFSANGTYTVTLTVTDSKAATVPSSQLVLVGLVAGVSFSNSPVVGRLANFSATGQGGIGVYVFSWNFGDGSSGSGQSLGHRYVLAGSYDVVLAVTDQSGLTTHVAFQLVVWKTPDFDGDGSVTVTDLANVAINYGAHSGQPLYDPRLDFNGDGAISVVDLAFVALYFGTTGW